MCLADFLIKIVCVPIVTRSLLNIERLFTLSPFSLKGPYEDEKVQCPVKYCPVSLASKNIIVFVSLSGFHSVFLVFHPCKCLWPYAVPPSLLEFKYSPIQIECVLSPVYELLLSLQLQHFDVTHSFCHCLFIASFYSLSWMSKDESFQPFKV